jgi:hypothetical protein
MTAVFLSALVEFDHSREDLFDSFSGRESAAAFLALSPATDLGTVSGEAGVDDPVPVIRAVGTLHASVRLGPAFGIERELAAEVGHLFSD